MVRHSGRKPQYAGYMANAFILPAGSNNNRVIDAGSEDLTGADGSKARFFLVSARPGMVYEQDAVFVPFAQIDPILSAHVRIVLRYPDGTVKETEGTGEEDLGISSARNGGASTRRESISIESPRTGTGIRAICPDCPKKEGTCLSGKALPRTNVD